jgi:hypothetical protein
VLAQFFYGCCQLLTFHQRTEPLRLFFTHQFLPNGFMERSLHFSQHNSGPKSALRAWVARRGPGISLLMLLALLLALSNAARAASTVTLTVGAGGDYPSISSALAAVPSPLPLPYELRLLDASYTENVLLTHTGSATNTLTIKPAPGISPVLTGTLTFGPGSRYVLLDGNNGSSRALTLRQPSQLVPTVVFSGDAASSEVRQTVILGSNGLLNSGVVVIGDGVLNGNDNNRITESFIGNVSPALLPTNLIYAANAGTGMNDGFTLSHNELFNFARTGVLVAGGNGDQWTISDNSFYYNVASLPVSAQTAIDFRPGSGANSATVRNNYIGGRAAGATGGIWENIGSQHFRGIVMDCGNSASLINEVSGNVVSGVSLTGVGSASLTALQVEAGRSELTGNVLGTVSNTGTSGVNSLVSRATTVLSSFTVSSGQLMVVESGLTVVLGNLSNAGILNHTGGDILIQGNFTNTGTFAQTLGDIEIKGDMLNSGQFTCSTGKVKLTGNGPQQVSGGLYFNLEVNGPGTKTLSDDIDIYNGVQMLSGILATGPYRLKLNPLANLTETDASYVLGRVEVRRTPVAGTTEDFGGVGLLLTPALGSVLPGATLVSRVTGVAPMGVGSSQGILRYFDISAPVSSGLNAAMTINYFPHELNGIAPANLRFFKSPNSGASWQNMGYSSTSSNSLTLNNVAGFSRWTLGNVLQPLPVELAAFRAERRGPDARLSWTTASEHHNRGFSIETSTDGKSFQTLGFVAGRGDSYCQQHYQFVDASEGKTGLRYYRLRQEDVSGKTTYYAPQTLLFEASATSLAAYPSRFAQELTVEIASPVPATARLRLLDNSGRTVWQADCPLVTGLNPLRARPACAAGAYMLTAEVGGQVLRQRLLKE